jgi:chaperonin cofactor prefoldin
MPAFSADQGQGELRLTSSRWSLGLRLDAGQAQDFDVLSRWATAHREWRFVTEVSVGQLDDLVWLPDTDRPHEPSDEQIVSCGRVEAPTLSSVPLTEARSRPAPQPLAKRVIWTWTVDPPRVPQGADHDPLIHQWNELDSEFDRRLRTAHEGLDQIEAKRTSLLKRFSRLASEMLGFSRSREDLSHQASMINSVPISSVGPIQAIERVQKLYELEERVEAVREELGKTEQEAIIKEAREEQEHQWAAEQAKAQVRIAKIAEEKSTIETKIEEVHDAFGELNTIADRKDRRARSKRLKSDQERLEKRLGELESEEKRHRELLESPFEFRHPRPSPSKGAPKKGRKGRFVPEVTSRPELRIPAEALPAVGTLRVRQESRFLIINGWDDLEGGEAEAKRLGARLVAPAEGS